MSGTEDEWNSSPDPIRPRAAYATGTVVITAVQVAGVIAVVAWGVSIWAASNASAERAASGVPDASLPTPRIQPGPPPPDPVPLPAIVDIASVDATPLAGAITTRVDAAWLDRVSDATGIPHRVLNAYAGASIAIATEQPSCNLGWTTLAAIGHIESNDGRYGGATVLDSGYSDQEIVGPELSGGSYAGIRDSDDGLWDGDTKWDRAVGPFQFIPQTWARWGADGNGDGLTEPVQVDDAALAAARYLCHAGDLSAPATWRAAVFSYNHSDVYVDDVAVAANRVAGAAG